MEPTSDYGSYSDEPTPDSTPTVADTEPTTEETPTATDNKETEMADETADTESTTPDGPVFTGKRLVLSKQEDGSFVEDPEGDFVAHFEKNPDSE